ncbi:hypothetical protein [Phaffia rhodozyma]|uniref:Uncharacterized protein n=1 Tax=Phaffia rhodozyma TaxID=264483 RepID=A0A0F7SVV8_PHARH|nr:hypothetical protein [Phaffia rhodozyma]
MANPRHHHPIAIRPPSVANPLQPSCLFRLSDDSLEALRKLVLSGSQELVELDFGDDEPTLYIPAPAASSQPARTYSLSLSPLSPPYEILNRSTAHPQSPYTLLTIPATRYSIRQTTVSDAARHKLRLGAELADKKREDRKIVQLETDPVRSQSRGRSRGGKSQAAGSVRVSSGSSIDRIKKVSNGLGNSSPLARADSLEREYLGPGSGPVSTGTNGGLSVPLSSSLLKRVEIGGGPSRGSSIDTLKRGESRRAGNGGDHRESSSEREILGGSMPSFKRKDRSDSEAGLNGSRSTADKKKRRTIDASFLASSIKKPDAHLSVPSSTVSTTSDQGSIASRGRVPSPDLRHVPLQSSHLNPATARSKDRKLSPVGSPSSSARPAITSPAGKITKASSSVPSPMRKQTNKPSSSTSASMSTTDKPKQGSRSTGGSKARDFSSSSSSEGEDDRVQTTKTESSKNPSTSSNTNTTNTMKKRRGSFSDSSASSSASPPRHHSRSRPLQPPPVPSIIPPSDPVMPQSSSPPSFKFVLPSMSLKDLRERFKRLYPTYQALNEKLEIEKRRAESVLAGEREEKGLSWKELERDVKIRGKLHKELEEIKERLKKGAERRKMT